MLDIKFIRENKDVIQAGADKKRIKFNIDELIAVDDKRKEIQAIVDEMRTKQNTVSQEIPNADADRKESLLSEMKELKEKLTLKEEELRDVMKEWHYLMLQVPNIPDMSVPDGKDDSENQELRAWGEKPSFDFEPKNHVDLMLDLDMVDFERGSKVAGFRGYFLKNDGARLQMAVMNFVRDFISKKGYQEMIVPSLVKKESLYGTGYLPQGEDDLYKTQDDDYLGGTGEVATMNFHAGELLKKEDLPIKYLAYSPCFRREAGSHGKDTKGLMRVHEFHKLEQIILCEASHEESVKYHEELQKNSEEIMQALNIPHHVVLICGGDLGLGQVKKYDIEAWVPSENTYRETHSASYFHDFQTRRLNIKYQDGDKKRYAHSLNNTAIALPRVLIPIVENNQMADGSIKIPEVLIPYMGKDIIKK